MAQPKPLYQVFDPLFEEGLSDEDIRQRFEDIVDYYRGVRPDLTPAECQELALQNAGYMAVAIGGKVGFERLKATLCDALSHPVFGDTIPESGDAYDIGSEED